MTPTVHYHDKDSSWPAIDDFAWNDLPAEDREAITFACDHAPMPMVIRPQDKTVYPQRNSVNKAIVEAVRRIWPLAQYVILTRGEVHVVLEPPQGSWLALFESCEPTKKDPNGGAS